jgi:hypothetical protein
MSKLTVVPAFVVPSLPFIFSLHTFSQGFGSVSGSAWIRINLSYWIRIRIQIADPDPGGKKWPTKIEKSTEFSFFQVLDVLF